MLTIRLKQEEDSNIFKIMESKEVKSWENFTLGTVEHMYIFQANTRYSRPTIR